LSEARKKKQKSPEGSAAPESDLDRPSNLRRDAALYWRVISRLKAYKIAVFAAFALMALEAALGVASISMIHPVLKVVFEEKTFASEDRAEDYPLLFSEAPGENALLLEGYFFLGAHRDEAIRRAQERARETGQSLSLRAGTLYVASPRLWRNLRESLASESIVVEPLPATLARAKPVGASDDFPAPPSWVDSWKIAGLDRIERWLESLQDAPASSNSPAAEAPRGRWRFVVLKWLVAILLALTLTKVTVAFFAAYLGQRLGFAIIRDMRDEFYRHALTLDFKYYDDRSVGDLMSRVTADLASLQTVVTMVFSRFFHAPIKALFFLAGMIYLSPQLTALALLALAPISSLLLYFSNRVRKASRRIQKHRADLSTILQETFSSIRTVKAYCMEEREADRFSNRSNRLFRQQNRGAAFEEVSSQANELIMVSVLSGLVLFGGYYVLVLKAIDGAAFVTFLALLGSMWGPIRAAAKSMVKIQQGLAGAERVFEIMDERPAIVDKPGATEFDGSDPTIEFRDVSFSYGEGRPVFQRVSLKASAGRMIALAGRTGSGKTTLACLVPRFYEATEGVVLAGGRDVRDYAVRSLRDKIAYVSQRADLFDDTIRSNIAYGRPSASREEIERAARAANIHDEIAAFPEGYDTLVGGQGAKLSGGQRQRVAIARAFLKDAPILILDEATSALDVETESLVQQALDRLMQGRAAIVIAHRLSTIRHADEILFLKDGVIVERGSHETLMALGGEYARFQRLQETGGASTAEQRALRDADGEEDSAVKAAPPAPEPQSGRPRRGKADKSKARRGR
jgi:subfamily B ATP-binding cassette protein MsbA